MEKLFGRRSFIRTSLLAGLSLAVPTLAMAMVKRSKRFTMGVIADLHHDIMHDGTDRLKAFLAEMEKTHPDMILQLGDFAYPEPKNQQVLNLFNQAHPQALHVIGNHDTDNGHTHQQCVDTWGMRGAYYAQKVNDFWIVVLNGNEKGSPAYKGGYPAYIGPEQTQWLKGQLAEINGPIIIVCHQPLVGWLSVDNADEIINLISSAKDRVVMVINGHTHLDMLAYAGGIPYLTINSASYFWVGQNYIHESYSNDIHQAHPWISRTCPYKAPLFTTLIINPHRLTIEVKAKPGEWVGKTPAELGYVQSPLTPGNEIVPFIRHRELNYKG